MGMGVNQSRKDRAALQIHDRSVRSHEALDIRRRADGQKAITTDRNRLRDAEILVRRYDLGVEVDGVGKAQRFSNDGGQLTGGSRDQLHAPAPKTSTRRTR